MRLTAQILIGNNVEGCKLAEDLDNNAMLFPAVHEKLKDRQALELIDIAGPAVAGW